MSLHGHRGEDRKWDLERRACLFILIAQMVVIWGSYSNRLQLKQMGLVLVIKLNSWKHCTAGGASPGTVREEGMGEGVTRGRNGICMGAGDSGRDHSLDSGGERSLALRHIAKLSLEASRWPVALVVCKAFIQARRVSKLSDLLEGPLVAEEHEPSPFQCFFKGTFQAKD